MIATIVIAVIIGALVVLAIRYMRKNGTCADCPQRGKCHAHAAGHSCSANDNASKKSPCNEHCEEK